MRTIIMRLLALFVLTSLFTHAQAQSEFTGDTRLSCEALLCLSSGTRPGECSPSLSRYFGIEKRKFSDTIKARMNFLDLCPAASQSPEMKSLVRALANASGRCDSQSLNRSLLVSEGGGDNGNFVSYIRNQMPAYCRALASHAYTDLDGTLPRYVGTPETGGYWVEAKKYQAALAEYKARQAAAHQAAQQPPAWGEGN